MAKRMTEKQLAAWKDNVIDYACRMTAKFNSIEVAAERVWRFYGCPTEIKGDKIIIWFGREKSIV